MGGAVLIESERLVDRVVDRVVAGVSGVDRVHVEVVPDADAVTAGGRVAAQDVVRIGDPEFRRDLVRRA